MNKKLLIILEIFVVTALYTPYLWGIEVHEVVTDPLTQDVLGNCITKLVFPTGINTDSDYKEVKELISTLYDTYGMTHDIFISQVGFNGDVFYWKLDRFDGQEPIFVPLQKVPGISSEITLEEFVTRRYPSAFGIHLAPKSSINPYLPEVSLPSSQNLYGSLPANAPHWLKNVPWYLVQDGVDYVKRTYNADLGTWETYLMAAIWDAEGADLKTAFGIRHYDNAYDKAEECAATIYKYINRFWNHLEEIKNNPQEAEQFGKALVATAALELYRAGEDLFEYFRANVLKMLVPDYLDFLNRGKESNIDKADTATKRLNYAQFLLEFIPEDFSVNFDYRRVARYFLDRFQSPSESDQFLIFATFLLPYEGMNYSSGYCPIWDMGGSFWRGAYEEKPGHFELNSNWGMNVYSNLSYLLREMPTVPVTTPIVSYFLSRKYF